MALIVKYYDLEKYKKYNLIYENMKTESRSFHYIFKLFSQHQIQIFISCGIVFIVVIHSVWGYDLNEACYITIASSGFSVIHIHTDLFYSIQMLNGKHVSSPHLQVLYFCMCCMMTFSAYAMDVLCHGCCLPWMFSAMDDLIIKYMDSNFETHFFLFVFIKRSLVGIETSAILNKNV